MVKSIVVEERNTKMGRKTNGSYLEPIFLLKQGLLFNISTFNIKPFQCQYGLMAIPW